MVTIDQVHHWFIDRGISHVVTSCGDGLFLLCGQWIVCGPVRSEELPGKPGKRICRKCRERLGRATLRTDGETTKST